MTNLDHLDIRKMNPEVKAKWLEDLRSGEFRQGRSHLKDGFGNMCCLGVLAHQFNPEWVGDGSGRLVPVVNGENLSDGGIEINQLSGKLNSTFLASVGISDAMASLLMSENDNGGSFSYIADIIEEKL